MASSRRMLLLLAPNALSAARLGLAVWFPFAESAWRPGLIAAAGVSDFADGYLARRFNLATWIGGLLDAVADKLFAVVVLGVVTVEGRLAAWQTAILLTRDLMVGAIAGYAALRRRWRSFKQMPARRAGKATTAAMFLLLLAITVEGMPGWATTLLISITGALSVGAAADYLLVFLGKLSRTAVVR